MMLMNVSWGWEEGTCPPHSESRTGAAGQGRPGRFLGHSVHTWGKDLWNQDHQPSGWSVKVGNLSHKLTQVIFPLMWRHLAAKLCPRHQHQNRAPRSVLIKDPLSLPKPSLPQSPLRKTPSRKRSLQSLHLKQWVPDSGCFRRRAVGRWGHLIFALHPLVWLEFFQCMCIIFKNKNKKTVLSTGSFNEQVYMGGLFKKKKKRLHLMLFSVKSGLNGLMENVASFIFWYLCAW